VERERLVLYLEKSDVIRMLSRAKEDGETLVEWARNVLRNELTISRPSEAPRSSTAGHKPRKVRAGAESTTVQAVAVENPTRHTAESNWRTCLCETCVQKRKAVA